MKNKKLWITVGILIIVSTGATFHFFDRQDPQEKKNGYSGMDGAGRPMPVTAATVRGGDIDVVINALGTVTALNTATVKARVDGQLARINFQDGQLVKAESVLAEIDPRPFQIQLNQANGQLVRDQALLANAKIDYERYAGLLAKDSIAKQQVDAQESLVHQYEGTVLADRAQVDNAKLQLGFTRITAPITGRLGLRQIDVGNMVHGTDANGLVVITQIQPIFVIFAIPADSIPAVLPRLSAGESLVVEAFDRDGKNKLATGKLLMADNQIDATTGTVKLKAEFTNSDNKLFPNQFVNVRLRIETRHNAILIPAAAIQRGTPGTFVYVVGTDQAVTIRAVTPGPTFADTVAIEKGLALGEQVVTDGADKLREGAKVDVSSPAMRNHSRQRLHPDDPNADAYPGGHRGKHRDASGQEDNKAPAQ
ncbi:MAG: MdtA/MuxA family multidrug efflux RND transporter periplasmic adaptor subunit [Pseudomonadota bacterium]